MFQKGSYDFENQLAGFIAMESATADKSNGVNESQARDEVLDARQEQQGIAIMQNLNHRH